MFPSRSPYRLGCDPQLLLQRWPACHRLLATAVMDQTSETASEPPVKHVLLENLSFLLLESSLTLFYVTRDPMTRE